MFGSQCVVGSIQAKLIGGKYIAFTDNGREATDLEVLPWALRLVELGAGEILVTSIDREGTAEGYDLDLIHAVSSVTTIPIIACGGVGRYEHYAEGVRAGASAVAAANLWHFRELSDRGGKAALARAKVPVRL